MSKLWHENGYVVIPVTQDHIDHAMEKLSSHCAVAEAIKQTIAGVTRVAVDVQTIRFTYQGLRYVFLTPPLARELILHFDQGERELLRPVTLRMRPAMISRAGKKRRECPSDAELRGSGLTVAKEQLHLDALDDHKRTTFAQRWRDTGYEPQRHTATGERNRDPERSDGLYCPPQRRKPRVARTKISTVTSRGCIPTTLGGPLPGVSVLARREFGLRVLRK